jgi:hypothetical protein
MVQKIIFLFCNIPDGGSFQQQNIQTSILFPELEQEYGMQKRNIETEKSQRKWNQQRKEENPKCKCYS